MKISPKEELINMALGYLVSRNKSSERYVKYVKLIKSQIGLIRKVEGRSLSINDWVLMAIELGRQALVRDIGAKRIAESIYPLVDGSGQLDKFAKYPSWLATNLLLSLTKSDDMISQMEKRFLAQVINELQNLHRKNH